MKRNRLTAEIRIRENTMGKELLDANRLSLCHNGWVKDYRGHLVNQPPWKLNDKC